MRDYLALAKPDPVKALLNAEAVAFWAKASAALGPRYDERSVPSQPISKKSLEET